MDTPPLFIAGAGIAGLAASLALAAHEAVIFEQAKTFSSLGAGLQLGPNAVQALRKLGAWERVEPTTSSPPEIHMRDGLSGKLLKRLILGKAFENRYGAPYRVALRADLHEALLAGVKNNKRHHIELGSMLQATTLRPNAVDISVNGRIRTSHAMIATDGVQSKIRQTLFPHAAAHSTGEVHHRALFKPNDEAGADLSCVNLWMLPRGHVVHYPVGHERRLNLVVVTPENTSVATFLENACPALARVTAPAMAHFTPWPAYTAPPLPTWVKGNVLLLGDAAHGTVPYLAQGAAMALEDAACLSDALKSASTWQHVFAETATRRMRRTTALHKQSLAAGRTYHAASLTRLARNTVLGHMPDALLMQQLDWLYKH